MKEREEAKRRILEENPNIPKDTLEFMLSLPKERKIPSHGTGNYTCNSRATRRNGKTIEEKERGIKNYNLIHPIGIIIQIIRFAWRPLSRISGVLVVPPEPRPGFVTPFRRPVEPLVHTPEHVEAACIGGVGVVDDAVGECERAHARSLAGIGGDVSAGHGRKLARCRVEDFC